MEKFIRRIIQILILSYIGFCIAVYYKPEWFFYNPDNNIANVKNAVANGYPAEVVQYTSQDGTPLYAWYTKPKNKDKIIVFLHGNSYNIEKFYHKLIPFVDEGYGTFIPEYRGFGNIAGPISQKGIEQDSIAAIRYLQGLGYKNSDIIIYGMSLGSYAALYSSINMQKNINFAGIILEVPFDNITNVVKKTIKVPLPLNYIIKDKYDNTSLIKNIKSPLLIMGGRNDKVVPVILAENLSSLAPKPKKMIIYEGSGHNDLYNVRNYRDILEWIEQQR